MYVSVWKTNNFVLGFLKILMYTMLPDYTQGSTIVTLMPSTGTNN